MAKTVEIPDELHDELASMAADEGMPLDAFIARKLMAVTQREKETEELLERIRSRPRVDLGISAADLIREGREERGRQLTERWLSSTPRR